MGIWGLTCLKRRRPGREIHGGMRSKASNRRCGGGPEQERREEKLQIQGGGRAAAGGTRRVSRPQGESGGARNGGEETLTLTRARF